jgi:4-methyl-5(b-hydroxyethyl)-thiazole monophosphate biosynthesis
MATMLVPLANGVEEMEAVIVIDVLRRAGWTVIVAATGETLTVTASRGVRIQADIHWREIADHLEVAAGIVIAGGAKGVSHLCENQDIIACIKRYKQEDRLIAAICAGSLVLQEAGILNGHRFTCYPGIESQIDTGIHATDKTVRDGNLITSQGPGTAFDFALALIEFIDGKTAADSISRQLLC